MAAIANQFSPEQWKKVSSRLFRPQIFPEAVATTGTVLTRPARILAVMNRDEETQKWVAEWNAREQQIASGQSGWVKQ